MGTISKALDLLDHFSADRGEIGLAEFVRLSGRDKATVHRHLSALAQKGFLEQDGESRAYRLGPAFLRFAALREALFPMRTLLQPIVLELSETVGELAHASVLEDSVMSSLVHADPCVHGVQVNLDISEPLPLHATSSGLAALSFCAPQMRNAVLARPLVRHTPQTIADRETLERIMDLARAHGLCTLVGAFEDGVSSIGAPLFGEGQRVVGALAIALPTARASQEKMRAMAVPLLRGADRASVALGGDFPSGFHNSVDTWARAAFDLHRAPD